MGIRDQAMSDMKDAMRAKEQLKLDTIRFFQAAVKKFEIDSRPKEINEDDVINVLKKMVKQHQESIEQFKAANRTDLVQKEEAELKILETYLPAQMGRDEIEKIVIEVIATTGANSAKQMGVVMKEVQLRTKGAADNKIVSELVKSKLQ